MLRITARARVKPTEDEARVAKALTLLFPGARVERAGDELVATPPGRVSAQAFLARLRELIRSQRIPDTARGQMLSGLSDDGLRARFALGKQAAAVGRAHFGAIRGPLGDIEVELAGDEAGEVERAIYHVAPDTTVDVELAEIPPSERPVP